MSDLLHLPVTTLQGDETTFGALADGRAALVVNVATYFVCRWWFADSFKAFADAGATPPSTSRRPLHRCRRLASVSSAT